MYLLINELLLCPLTESGCIHENKYKDKTNLIREEIHLSF